MEGLSSSGLFKAKNKYQGWYRSRLERQYISVDDFQLDDSLIGLKLASPWRRLLAILFDLVGILFMSTYFAFFMTFVAIYFVIRRVTQSFKNGVAWGKFLCILTLIVAFLFLPFSSHMTESQRTLGEPITTNIAGIISMGLAFHQVGAEDDLELKEQGLRALYQKLLESGLSEKAALGALVDLNEGLVKDAQLNSMITELRVEVMPEEVVDPSVEIETVKVQEPPIDSGIVNVLKNEELSKGNPADEVVDNGYEGVQAIIIGLLTDLGITFGWAAFYFTVFTSVTNGRTPGKKLLGIRVLQMDASRLTLWESFSRYGGYTAGLATGLLGFLQIYWDRNRQAVHDKISGTFVVRDR